MYANSQRSALQDLLQDAFDNCRMVDLGRDSYTVEAPIVITVPGDRIGPMVNGRGAKILGALPPGTNLPLITIQATTPGVNLRNMVVQDLIIQGNGHESDGLKIACPGNDSWIYNWRLSGVSAFGCGGYGLNVEGSVFEGLVLDSWVCNNTLGGARFAHAPAGVNQGQCSAVRWLGGGARKNAAGILLDNNCRDLRVEHAAFIENTGYAISAELGFSSVSNSHFENNGRDVSGRAIGYQVAVTLRDCTFSTAGVQTTCVYGYNVGDSILDNCGHEYYGPGADPVTMFAVNGAGRLLVTNNEPGSVVGTTLVKGPLRTI